jgi:hypothetical protein
MPSIIQRDTTDKIANWFHTIQHDCHKQVRDRNWQCDDANHELNKIDEKHIEYEK